MNGYFWILRKIQPIRSFVCLNNTDAACHEYLSIDSNAEVVKWSNIFRKHIQYSGL